MQWPSWRTCWNVAAVCGLFSWSGNWGLSPNNEEEEWKFPLTHTHTHTLWWLTPDLSSAGKSQKEEEEINLLLQGAGPSSPSHCHPQCFCWVMAGALRYMSFLLAHRNVCVSGGEWWSAVWRNHCVCPVSTWRSSKIHWNPEAFPHIFGPVVL